MTIVKEVPSCGLQTVSEACSCENCALRPDLLLEYASTMEKKHIVQWAIGLVKTQWPKENEIHCDVALA